MSGLIPVQKGTNTPYFGSVHKYYVSASDSTALFVGDPVALSNTNADPTGKYPTVLKATLAASNQLIGSVVAVLPVDRALTGAPLEVTYRPASTAAYVLVADDPDQEFIIIEDADTTPITASALGNLGIAVAGGGGSTIYGTSSVALDSSSFASGTATGQYLLLGMVDRDDLDLHATSGSASWFRVKINEAMHGLATPPTSV